MIKNSSKFQIILQKNLKESKKNLERILQNDRKSLKIPFKYKKSFKISNNTSKLIKNPSKFQRILQKSL